jgi:hypothetical protein
MKTIFTQVPISPISSTLPFQDSKDIQVGKFDASDRQPCCFFVAGTGQHDCSKNNLENGIFVFINWHHADEQHRTQLVCLV